MVSSSLPVSHDMHELVATPSRPAPGGAPADLSERDDRGGERRGAAAGRSAMTPMRPSRRIHARNVHLRDTLNLGQSFLSRAPAHARRNWGRARERPAESASGSGSTVGTPLSTNGR